MPNRRIERMIVTSFQHQKTNSDAVAASQRGARWFQDCSTPWCGYARRGHGLPSSLDGKWSTVAI